MGYVIDKKYHLPPVMFDADELEAIALGINMVCNWTDEKFSAKAQSALEKIQAVLSDSLLRDMEQLSTYSEESHRKIPWEADFSEIRECIRSRRKIAFQYRDLKNRVSERTIRPLSLGFFGPVWLVTGWCESRKDFRNFRLDRIRNFQSTERYFKDERGKNLKAYLARSP